MQPFPRMILLAEAERHGMTVAEVAGPSRKRKYLPVRREIMRQLFDRGLSHQQIGRVLKREHTTIGHHLRMMGLRRGRVGRP